jgi:hypothetical protein
LDLCDEAVAAASVRGHRWPWLRDESGDEIAVDGWWPQLGVALLLYDGSIETEPRAITGTIVAHGFVPVVFDLQALEDPAGWSPGRRSAYVAMFRMLLTEVARPAADDEPPDSVTAGGFLWGAAFEDDHDADEDEDEDDDEWDEDDADLAEWIAAPRPELGWRARPVLLALLEAAVLNRRSTSRELAEPFEALEIQALAALALMAEHGRVGDLGATRDGLAVLLAADDRELHYALESLAGRGLAEPAFADPVHGGGVPWNVTATGNAAVETWVARCQSLFAGWPPDHPGVDDAVR